MAAATRPPHSSIAGCRRQRCPSCPQGRDPLTPLLPAGADPFAQQPPRVGSIPQASRSSCTGSRSDSGNRFAFFSRTRRRQWRRVFLAFSASAWQPVTTGLISPPCPARTAQPAAASGAGALSVGTDQRAPLPTRGSRASPPSVRIRAPAAPPGAWADTSSPLRLSGSQTLAAAAGLPGGMIAFSEYVRSYRLRKIQRNSYNLLPFVIIRHFRFQSSLKLLKSSSISCVSINFRTTASGRVPHFCQKRPPAGRKFL